jgi:hypothetical protein
LAAACNDMARVSIVALPPFFELYCTSIGPLPKRRATTCAAPVPSKHALIAEKAEGHHAHLASTLNGVHRRTRRRDSQSQSDQRCAEQADPRLGRHRLAEAKKFATAGHRSVIISVKRRSE